MCPASNKSSNTLIPVPDAFDIVAAARTWIGTPVLHQGRLKGVGVDCAGIIVGVARELGLSSFDTRAYGRTPDGVTLRRLCRQHMEPIDELCLGAVVLMKFMKHPHHLGIVGDKGSPFSLIHAYDGAAKCMEHILDGKWRHRICGIYKYRGVTDG